MKNATNTTIMKEQLINEIGIFSNYPVITINTSYHS